MFAVLLTVLAVTSTLAAIRSYYLATQLERERSFFYRDPAGWGAAYPTKHKCDFAAEEQQRLRGH